MKDLKAEIVELCRAEKSYRLSGSKHPAVIVGHKDRLIRMKQTCDELAVLMKES
jgi:hypothetical protein